MRKFLAVLILVLMFPMIGGCLNGKKIGSDLMEGAVKKLEATVDAKIQASIPAIEGEVNNLAAKVEAQATRHGIPADYIEWIKALLVAGLMNFLRNRKYVELSLWRKIFTVGLPAPTGTGNGTAPAKPTV